MWLTQLWVLSVVACSNPGAATESCTQHVIAGFASQDLCDAAVQPLADMLRLHKRREAGMELHVTCRPFTPDREA